MRRWPWLSFQMIAANAGIVLMLGYAWYWLFMHQSAAYSDRLMSTFNIEPGQVHAMFVDEVERQLWTSVMLGLLCAVLASVGITLVIIRPLGALARATDRLRQGDYRVRAQQSLGEVGALADTINALAAALEQEDSRRARYLADLGHELRTPITSLRGYTEGLEDGVFQADAKYFALMADELDHLTALTHSIEAMDLQVDQHTVVSGGTPLTEALTEAEHRWAGALQERGLTLDVRVDPALNGEHVALSDQALRRIVDNLISNMVKYADDESACAMRATRPGAQEVEITFSNSAGTLAAETVPMLFDRFFRASHSRTRARDVRSSGLGLSIVKQLCLSCGGSAQARLNQGTLVITIELPLSQMQGAAAQPQGSHLSMS